MKDTSESLRKILIQVQDHLMPLLDSYEQMLYHYFFRHTHLSGIREITVGTRSLQSRIGLGIGKTGSPPSQRIVSKKLRSLENKGCVKIHERGPKGTRVEVFLPHEMPGIIPDVTEGDVLDLERLDFFNDTNLRPLILEREDGLCFYCLRKIQKSNFTIDHVIPQCDGPEDNSYRNVVACCFECNSRKQNRKAADFLRQLYRDGLITVEEHDERRKALNQLLEGQLKPDSIDG